MSTPPGSPTDPAPPPPGPPSAVATHEDLRGLRRWVWVAGIWAVAASIVALIALLDQDDPQPQRDTTTASRVARVERELSGRINAVEDRAEQAGSADDLAKLERRLKRVEEDVSDAVKASETGTEAANDLEERVDELQQRVEELEADQNQQP